MWCRTVDILIRYIVLNFDATFSQCNYFTDFFKVECKSLLFAILLFAVQRDPLILSVMNSSNCVYMASVSNCRTT